MTNDADHRPSWPDVTLAIAQTTPLEDRIAALERRTTELANDLNATGGTLYRRDADIANELIARIEALENGLNTPKRPSKP